MRGRPYLQARKEPRTLIAMTASKTSSGYSTIGFHHTGDAGVAEEDVDLAQRRTVSSRYRRVSAESATFCAHLGHAVGGAQGGGRAASPSASASTNMTHAPSSTNSAALARPTLPAPPVMTHVFPVMIPTSSASSTRARPAPAAFTFRMSDRVTEKRAFADGVHDQARLVAASDHVSLVHTSPKAPRSVRIGSPVLGGDDVLAFEDEDTLVGHLHLQARATIPR